MTSITSIAEYGSSINPYVVFEYKDNTGATTVPYRSGNYDANSLTPDIGDFGACPF